VTSPRPFAVLGIFDGPSELLSAARTLRARHTGPLEAYTPYPVHGLDHALGLERSWIGGAVFVMGLLGAISAMAFQWWTSTVSYPIPTGGKPLFSWQAFVPVMFEATVLFAAFTAGLGMLLVANRLPLFGHPMLSSNAIAATTRDRFALSVEGVGDGLDPEAAAAWLLEAGAQTTEILHEPPPAPPLNVPRTAGAITLACVVAGAVTWTAVRLYPTLPPMAAMHEQPRLDAFAQMRMPVAGTVPRGALPLPFVTPEQAGAMLANPLPRSRAVLDRGRGLYGTHCAVCHGPVGDGVPLLSSAYGAKPANLHGAVAQYPDGRIYGVIALGKNAMPSYAAETDDDDRWAVVHYVRALERAQNAEDGDLP
jgi:mono/diheme cytochrome c family protein